MDQDLNDDARRSIVAHLSHLRAAHGAALADPDLVEPDGAHFPDVFTRDPEGIDRLLRRMMTYAPLGEGLDVQLAFVEPETESPGGGGGCGSGACGSGGGAPSGPAGGALETPDGYAVVVAVADVADVKALTASMARSLGRIVLFEADESVDPRDEAALSELTAVACGLGVLLLNGSAIYKKGCGGMRLHQATALGPQELALALALFVRAHDKKPSAVRRHLEVTQREAFDAALDWVDGQPKLVRALVEAPETLEDGVFELERGKGFFSKLFGGSKKDADDENLAAAARRRAAARSDDERRRLADARALVEEALKEG